MRLKTVLGLGIPLACSALFARLGVWQLDRRQERLAVNAGLTERLAGQVKDFGSVTSDALDKRWTPVSLSGVFRYDLEQVLAGRASEGSPGVHLLTPLQRPNSDTLVLVTRGWVYSPDAASADLGRWREADTVTLSGYLLPLPPDGSPPPADRSLPLRQLSRSAIETRVGLPIAAVQVVMTSDSAARLDSVPRRLPPPVLDNGPHLSYAIQWFAFALIALVGGGVLARTSVVSGRAKG